MFSAEFNSLSDFTLFDYFFENIIPKLKLVPNIVNNIIVLITNIKTP